MNLPERPIAFTLASTNHGTMLVNRFDSIMGFHGAPYGVCCDLLEKSCFDPQEINNTLILLQERRKHFGDGLVTVDCGANVGVHTIEWAKLMHGWGTVLGIEAQERIFYALAGNVTINNCFNAKVINAAIGYKVGTINIPVPNYFKNSSFGSLELQKKEQNEGIGQEIDYSPEYTVPIALISLDSICTQNTRLDLVKIDIEGMEMQALEGGKESIERFKPILIVENLKLNKEELNNWLTSRNYKTYNFGNNTLGIHESDPTWKMIS